MSWGQWWRQFSEVVVFLGGAEGVAVWLQRTLELVPREVLPDGQLGTGGVAQFSPHHLRTDTSRDLHVTHMIPLCEGGVGGPPLMLQRLHCRATQIPGLSHTSAGP